MSLHLRSKLRWKFQESGHRIVYSSMGSHKPIENERMTVECLKRRQNEIMSKCSLEGILLFDSELSDLRHLHCASTNLSLI